MHDLRSTIVSDLWEDGVPPAANIGKLWITTNDHDFECWEMKIHSMPVNEDKEKETKKN